MKKLLLFTVTILFSNLIFSQTNLFEHPEFDEIANSFLGDVQTARATASSCSLITYRFDRCAPLWISYSRPSMSK